MKENIVLVKMLFGAFRERFSENASKGILFSCLYIVTGILSVIVASLSICLDAVSIRLERENLEFYERQDKLAQKKTHLKLVK